VSIELTLYSSGRLSDLVNVFPPYDRTYQHDPLMPSMRPVSTLHRRPPITTVLLLISLRDLLYNKPYIKSFIKIIIIIYQKT
jgi:hypothetical protein